MLFSEAIEYLLGLGHETMAIKLGLEKTQYVLSSLGNPHSSYYKVQIAGTNGKGSTASFLDAICRAAHIRTGLYTSPHLTTFTERIRINGRKISEADFAVSIDSVRKCASELLEMGRIESLPTFFEHMTLSALDAFSRSEIDLAILETGLGGRLDATTAAGAEIAVITPIDIDHQEYLGNTLAEIAFEKASIIGSGTNAVVVAPQDQIANDVILQRCNDLHASPVMIHEQNYRVDDVTEDGRFIATFDFPGFQLERAELGLRGRHQMINAATAVASSLVLREQGFKIADSAIRHGLENVYHPGRLEIIEGAPPLLLDGAHNSSAAKVLAEYLTQFVKTPITLLFGMMRDKELDSVASTLFPLATNLVLTEVNNPRTLPVEALETIALKYIDADKIHSLRDTTQALTLAKQLALADDGLVCITGSLYLIGELIPSTRPT
jgi:dihydrofolate synthase/folylpolyglutamate synthase